MIEQNIPLNFFENLRLSASNVTRVNNVDVIITEDGEELGFCHIPSFQALEHDTQRFGTVGILLAMQHLNEGDGRVIPEVEGLDKRCNIRFTTELFDTRSTDRIALNKMIDLTRLDPSEDRLPCAVLGSTFTSTTVPLAIITGIEGYPLFSSGSTGSQLDDKSRFNLFGRVIPSDDGAAVPLIYYLNNKLGVSHFGVLHIDDLYGRAFSTSIQKAVKTHAPHMVATNAEVPTRNLTQNDLEIAISILKSTQFRYFFAVISVNDYNAIMEQAYKQGIAGPGYTWIFSDTVWPEAVTKQQFYKNSPLALASAGISFFAAEAGVPGMPIYDKFVQEFYNILENDKMYLESKLPNLKFRKDLSYMDPSLLACASFLYDSTIALGIGACDAKENKTYFKGEDHYRAVLQRSFMGTSGNVTFDRTTGSRDPLSALFSIVNLQQHELEGNSAKHVAFSGVPVDLFQNNKWDSLSPYVFSDGSTVPPPDLPVVSINHNYYGTALRVVSLVLCAIILLTSAALVGWTYHNRKGKIVLASQPVFLYIICLGTFMMGSAIIPLSIDDEIVDSYGCTIACNAFIWLFTPGFSLAFSALYCKMRKLNKIFFNRAMRRTKVELKHVIWPMIILFSVNVIVLIVGTVISPLLWRRSSSSWDTFGRTLSSSGRCYKQNSLFTIFLIIINFAALCLTLYEAYKARHIKTVLGETKYVAMATSSILLVFVMGIPIGIIANDNPSALFFVTVFIIFIISISLLFFIFFPKYNFHRELMRGNKSMTFVVKDFTERSFAQTNKSSVVSHNLEHVESADGSNWRRNNREITIEIEMMNQENVDQKQKLQHQQQQLNDQKRELDDQKKQLDELMRLLDSEPTEKDQITS